MILSNEINRQMSFIVTRKQNFKQDNKGHPGEHILLKLIIGQVLLLGALE